MTATHSDQTRVSSNTARTDSAPRRLTTETKSSFKTTEMVFYVLAVVGVIIASYMVKHTAGHHDYFRADKAWFYIVLLTIGYLGSRGLAKSGSRDAYDASRDHAHNDDH